MRTQAENTESLDPSTGEQDSRVNSLHALQLLSPRVAAKSKIISSLIRSLDGQLAALNFEMSVWFEAEPLEAGESEEDERDDGTIRKWRPVTLLGYCRLKNAWGLAVKEAEFEVDTDDFENEIEVVTNSKDPVPLTDADSRLQLGAMYVIPQLVGALKKKAFGFLEAIRNTEKLVQGGSGRTPGRDEKNGQ